MISKVSKPVYIAERSSIVIILPQEILCEIFSYLREHPVHFTRVAQVCRAWNFAADYHLFWRQLAKTLQLPDPKPRAYKYKTYKSIVSKNWGKFCTLCHLKRTRSNGFQIQPALVDMVKIDKIDFKSSKWFKVVLHEDKKPDVQKEKSSYNSQEVVKSKELHSRFLKHLLCCRCNAIYSRYVREEGIKDRRNLLSVKLGEFGLTIPTKHDQCSRFILYGEGNPDKIAQELAKTMMIKVLLLLFNFKCLIKFSFLD
jgi:hypothetical protein